MKCTQNDVENWTNEYNNGKSQCSLLDTGTSGFLPFKISSSFATYCFKAYLKLCVPEYRYSKLPELTVEKLYCPVSCVKADCDFDMLLFNKHEVRWDSARNNRDRLSIEHYIHKCRGKCRIENVITPLVCAHKDEADIGAIFPFPFKNLLRNENATKDTDVTAIPLPEQELFDRTISNLRPSILSRLPRYFMGSNHSLDISDSCEILASTTKITGEKSILYVPVYKISYDNDSGEHFVGYVNGQTGKSKALVKLKDIKTPILISIPKLIIAFIVITALNRYNHDLAGILAAILVLLAFFSFILSRRIHSKQMANNGNLLKYVKIKRLHKISHKKFKLRGKS
jgi:hypothetical protein